jgi:hypothetical protein
LLEAESYFGGEEGLADEIDIVENFEQVVCSLKEEGDMLISVGVGIDIEKIFFPLFDLLDDESCQLPIISDFQSEFAHRRLFVLLEEGLLCESIRTRQR